MGLKKSKTEVETPETPTMENHASKNEDNCARVDKIAQATRLLAEEFGIDESYYVTKVDDKGTSFSIGFSNAEYDITIKIKDAVQSGLV